MIRISFAILLCFLAVQMFGQKSLDKLLKNLNEESVPYISAESLRMEQQNGDVFIFDSREPEEFEVSAIEGAQFVGYNDFSEESITQSLPKQKNSLIVVYCSLGVRSEDIAEKLGNLGYSNVKNLYGGIFEWKNKGYPVVNTEGEETEDVHAFSRFWGRYLKKGNKVYE